MPVSPSPYILHLSKDKKFAKLLAGHESFSLSRRKYVYLHLCNSILGQQLSTTVAGIIRKRFLNLYTGTPSPGDILATPVETLRSIGLSGAKAGYIHNVASFAINPGMDDRALAKMSDEDIITLLTQIKGVGRWTVEMLLMFTLGREDVFAADDLGIQQAMTLVYKLESSDRKKLKEEMMRLSARWSPYRTYACLHLWNTKTARLIWDNKVRNPVCFFTRI